MADTLPTADVRAMLEAATPEIDEAEMDRMKEWNPVMRVMAAAPTLARELIAAREERDAAIDRRDFTTEWYATRIKTLEEWAKREGHWPTIACILANDAESTTAPSTYAQLLAMAEHRATSAEAERDRLRQELADLRANVRRFDPLAGENGYRHHKDGSRCLDPECRRAHALPAADRAAKEPK